MIAAVDATPREVREHLAGVLRLVFDGGAGPWTAERLTDLIVRVHNAQTLPAARDVVGNALLDHGWTAADLVEAGVYPPAQPAVPGQEVWRRVVLGMEHDPIAHGRIITVYGWSRVGVVQRVSRSGSVLVALAPDGSAGAEATRRIAPRRHEPGRYSRGGMEIYAVGERPAGQVVVRHH
jgi:hypothetical protein